MILVTQTRAPNALGDYVGRDAQGIESRIRIAPSTAKRGERFAIDVLLHEMIHAWQKEVLLGEDESAEENSYRGHGPRFAARCNEIGAKLGLKPVGVKNRDGLPDCAYWPMNVRPAGYYPEPWEPIKRAPNKGTASGDSGESDGEPSRKKAEPATGIVVDGERIDRAIDSIVTKIALKLGVRRADVLGESLLALVRELSTGKGPKAERVKATRSPGQPLRDVMLASAKAQDPNYQRSPALLAHIAEHDASQKDKP